MISLKIELFKVLRAYASLTPLSSLVFPAHLDFPRVHAFFLQEILLNPHFIEYPPSNQYQLIFWKWTIHNLEKMSNQNTEDFEIDPQIYEHYLALMPNMGIVPGATRPDHRDQLCPRGLPLQMLPAPSYITHFWEPLLNAPNSPGEVFLDHYETVTLLESRTTIESGTTGMRTWLASFVLADFISQRPDMIKNKRILELGSGIGFLGIILSRMQNFYPGERQALWLTDVNDNVLQRCQENLKMRCNKTSSSKIRCRFLDWSDALDDDRITAFHRILVEKIDADIIFGADIIFDPSLIPALTATLHMALQPGRQATSKVAIIAATVRNEETLAKFVEDAGRKSLQVQELSFSAQDVSFTQDVDKDAKNVKIFQITL